METNKLAINEPAPKFEAKAFHNEQIVDIRLDDYNWR